MNLKAMRAAALKAAQDIIDGAKAAGRDLTETEQTEVQAKFAEIDELDKKIDAAAKSADLVARIGSLGSVKADEDIAPSDQATSLGEHFIKHAGAALKGRAGGTRFTASAPEFKATPVTTGSLVNPVFSQSVVGLPLRRPVVADLLLSGTIGGSSYVYFVESAVSGGPDAVAENAAKPELSGGFTQTTESLKKIAGWTKESDELTEDFPALASVVQNRLLTRLALAEENEVLNGAGTGAHLTGLLQRSGIQTEVAANGGADNLDALYRAMTKVQTATFLTPDFIVLHPTDYQKLRLAKDANNQYFGGGPFYGAYGDTLINPTPGVWGTNTVVTPAITAGTALVGSSQAAQVFRKGGVRVEATNSNEDDFINNRIVVRAEERLLLACYVPAAYVKVTLT